MLYELSRSNRNYQINLEAQTNLTFGTHMHTSFELILVTEGELTCTAMGESYRIGAGQAILIPPNRLHSFCTETFSRNLLLVFSADFVGAFWRIMKDSAFVNPVFPCDAGIIEEYDWQGQFFLQKALLYRICGIAYKCCGITPLQDRNDILIQNIALYIQDNYSDDITLESLSKALGYHPCYLSGFLNKNFGMNFRTVVNRFRISAAADLLENSDATIAEIATASGFSTIRSFNRAFEKFFGSCPRDFRRRAHPAPADPL